MCAIAGILKLAAEDALLKEMIATMAHRGPDGHGIFQGQDCTLLHTRLAIIDPQGGGQPMTLNWAGERYVLVYNGELYNTAQLRRELETLGHHFQGHSDTEVVLHAFAQWREGCLDRMNGIFAFAVWEEQEKRLFLARDRIGVKPLFYMQHRSGLIFASEMKTILAYPTVRPELDAEGVGQLLLLGPGRLPGSGVFRGMRELEPGCFGWYHGGRLTVRRYWYLKDGYHTDSFNQTVEKVRQLVTDAITSQMVSDVPIGTFLSGGLDSSIITAICAAGTEGPLRTFSVDYENNDAYFVPGKFQPDSDGAYINQMVSYLGTEHTTTVLTAYDLINHLEEATVARDLPGMADVDFSLLAFCKEIRKDVKVALSGECADEIFGGYPWYRDPEIRTGDGFPWAQNSSIRNDLLQPKILQKSELKDLVMDAYRTTCRESDILPENSPEERRMKEMVNLNFRWFMQTLLDRKDRMSMGCGLEVRVPFCDYRIAEYLYRVPWTFKDHGGKEKGLLRTAMEGMLPDRVLWRKKSPYPKSFDPKYAMGIQTAFLRLCDDHNAPLFALTNREAVKALSMAEPKWPWYGQLMGRVQTMAYFLQMDFWLRHYGVDILL